MNQADCFTFTVRRGAIFHLGSLTKQSITERHHVPDSSLVVKDSCEKNEKYWIP